MFKQFQFYLVVQSLCIYLLSPLIRHLVTQIKLLTMLKYVASEAAL